MLKVFAQNSLVYGLANVIQKAVDYLANVVFIYLLSTSEYGIMALLPLIMTVMMPLLSLQLGASITRYYYKYLKSDEVSLFLGSVLSYMMIILCGLSIFYVFCSELLWRVIFPEISFVPYIVIAILITAADSINRTYITVLQIKKQVKRYAIFNNCYILFRVLFIIVAIYFNKTAYSYYVAYLCVVVTFVPISLYLLKSDVIWNLRKQYVIEAFKYASYILPVSIFIIANTFIDRHVIMKQLDMNSVGVYSAGVNVGQIIYFMAMVFNVAFLPFFMQAYEEDTNTFSKRIEPVYRIIFFVLNIAAFLLTVLSPLLVYVLPVTFHDAIKVVPFIAFLGVGQGLYQLYTNILSLDVEMLRFKILGVIISLLINIPLSYYLVNIMGIIGAAASSLLCMYISAFVYKLIVYKSKGPDLSFDFFVLPVCMFLVAMLVFECEKSLPLYIMIVIYLIIGGGMFYYFDNLYFKRKNFVIDILKKVCCYVKNGYK